MMRGFAGQSTALILLSLFYSVFLFIGFWMIRGYVMWWSQIAKYGSFKLLAPSPLAPGQAVNFQFSGFKQSSQNESLTVSLVAEGCGRDSDGDTTWSEAWRSAPMNLNYQPDPTGLNKTLSAISQPLTLAPYAGANAQNKLRWSVQVQQASHFQNKVERGFKFSLAPDMVAALEPSATHQSAPVKASAADIAQGIKVLGFASVIVLMIALGIAIHSVFFSRSFSPFLFMFSIAFGLVAHVCMKARHHMQSTGGIESMVNQRQSFAKLFKFIPALFFIAFFWDAIWPLLKRYL
jgi:hypothetical protein